MAKPWKLLSKRRRQLLTLLAARMALCSVRMEILEGHPFEMSHDENDRTIQVVDPDGRKHHFSYQHRGAADIKRVS